MEYPDHIKNNPALEITYSMGYMHALREFVDNIGEENITRQLLSIATSLGQKITDIATKTAKKAGIDTEAIEKEAIEEAKTRAGL